MGPLRKPSTRIEPTQLTLVPTPQPGMMAPRREVRRLSRKQTMATLLWTSLFTGFAAVLGAIVFTIIAINVVMAFAGPMLGSGVTAAARPAAMAFVRSGSSNEAFSSAKKVVPHLSAATVKTIVVAVVITELVLLGYTAGIAAACAGVRISYGRYPLPRAAGIQAMATTVAGIVGGVLVVALQHDAALGVPTAIFLVMATWASTAGLLLRRSWAHGSHINVC